MDVTGKNIRLVRFLGTMTEQEGAVSVVFFQYVPPKIGSWRAGMQVMVARDDCKIDRGMPFPPLTK
jgi:hypothetical protein